jgi:Family of unknown function (DUF6516)
MKATRVYYKKQRYARGIVEMVVWRLPALEVNRSHGYKYRLVFVRDGRRVLGYDNERGKGDHKHYGEQEKPYRFVDVPKLLRDFWKDVRRLK